MWEPKPRIPRLAQLPTHLQQQLLAVAPSTGDGFDYYPCSASLRSGAEIERVYVSAEIPYLRQWGDDRHRQEISVADLVSIRECTTRLPLRFANELYLAGESAMGGCFFVVTFAGGYKQAYSTGNAVDFVQYPLGYGPQDVIAVEPHAGRADSNKLHGARYYWCLYSG